MIAFRPQILQLVVPFITKYEGFSATPYTCPAGKRTIGYGEVMQETDTRQKITPKEALDFVKGRTLNEIFFLEGQYRDHPHIRSHQYAALVDFLYNLGRANFLSSTLKKKIDDAAPLAQIKTEFLRWVFAKGKKLPGLVKRRAEEYTLFATNYI